MFDSSFHAEIIAEAAQATKMQAEIIAEAAKAAEAAQAAQEHAVVIATAAETAKAHAEIITQAAATAQEVQTQADGVAEALRVSERRYRRLFETARDGILILDSETGKITDANPFMAELLGYSQDEFVGKELWEIGLLRDKKASQDAFGELQEKGYIRYENIPLENRRGERREVEFVSNLYPENGHRIIQCNIRDITDRKAMEKKLAAAATRNEHIAATLQRSMLQESPKGKFPGLEIDTLYVAALREAELGGDFFDAFALTTDKVALVVGDVSGKGLVAAARTAEVKYSLRALLHEHSTPELALAHLNGFIHETHRLDKDNEEAFIVLALVVVDTVTSVAVFSAAGAEPTLILRVDGTVEPVEITGLPLGIQPDAVYVAKTVHLEAGGTIVMATDGITEARRGQSFLGTEGLAALAEKTGPNAPLEELSQAIYGGAQDFAAKGLRDDVCLLLARFR
jgi:PAS domain S-box-containing protein